MRFGSLFLPNALVDDDVAARGKIDAVAMKHAVARVANDDHLASDRLAVLHEHLVSAGHRSIPSKHGRTERQGGDEAVHENLQLKVSNDHATKTRTGDAGPRISVF